MDNQEIKKDSNKALWLTAVVLAIFLAVLLTNGFGLLAGRAIDSPNLEIGNSPVLGNPNAEITIYEFSDFSCPYCAVADGENKELIAKLKKSNPDWEAPIPEIIKNYVNTGKAKLVFKYFPSHGTGEAAHKVAFCLNEQNLFWKFHNLAFANQSQLNDLDKMKSLALSIGANMTKLNACLNSTNFREEFQEDIDIGKEINLEGTPSFVIGSEIKEGVISYKEIKSVIDKLL